MASGDDGFDAVIPELPPDEDIEENIAHFLSAVRKGPRSVRSWVRTFSLRGACRCCGYLRSRLLVTRDRFVSKHGVLPKDSDQDTEAIGRYKELKRAVRCCAATIIQAAARSRISRRLLQRALPVDRLRC